MIGAWGPLVFTVSEKQVKTFDSFKRSESARWAKHDIHLAKPKPDFLGPGQGQITFNMMFTASLGVNPIKELDKLVRYVRSGEAHTLIIGSKRYGVGKWYISSVSEDMKHFDNRGNVLSGSASVTMEEYV